MYWYTPKDETIKSGNGYIINHYAGNGYSAINSDDGNDNIWSKASHTTIYSGAGNKSEFCRGILLLRRQ